MATIRSFAKDLKFSILKSFELYIFSFLAISSIQKGSGAIKSAFRNRVETNKSEGRDSTRMGNGKAGARHNKGGGTLDFRFSCKIIPLPPHNEYSLAIVPRWRRGKERDSIGLFELNLTR